MVKLISRILETLWNRWLFYRRGKKAFQILFEKMYRMGLEGMMFGYGGNVEDSGELNLMRYVKAHFREEQEIVVFDVGANIGGYTRACLEVFGSQLSAVYAFEPSSATFEILKENVDHPKVHLEPFGLGDKAGILTLYRNPDLSGMASVYDRRLTHFQIEQEQVEQISIKTIDQICDEERIKRIHLLKMDVEGHELSVLKGASRLLETGSIEFIQFEFGGCNIDSRTFFQDFYYHLKDQYNLYRVIADGLVQIEAYHENLEIFRTINYLAKRKNTRIKS